MSEDVVVSSESGVPNAFQRSRAWQIGLTPKDNSKVPVHRSGTFGKNAPALDPKNHTHQNFPIRISTADIRKEQQELDAMSTQPPLPRSESLMPNFQAQAPTPAPTLGVPAPQPQPTPYQATVASFNPSDMYADSTDAPSLSFSPFAEEQSEPEIENARKVEAQLAPEIWTSIVACAESFVEMNDEIAQLLVNVGNVYPQSPEGFLGELDKQLDLMLGEFKKIVRDAERFAWVSRQVAVISLARGAFVGAWGIGVAGARGIKEAATWTPVTYR